jgi:hypothetical protein
MAKSALFGAVILSAAAVAASAQQYPQYPLAAPYQSPQAYQPPPQVATVPPGTVVAPTPAPMANPTASLHSPETTYPGFSYAKEGTGPKPN